MSRFVTGKELEDAIGEIIHNAKENLVIVSPFIKLDDYFKQLIGSHAKSPFVRITVLFGKNEGRPGRSMGASDIDFFKKFLNVTIVYVPQLHAKYYGNERQGVITSLNLYDYSLQHNIEYGVYSEVKPILGDVAEMLGRKSSDTDAYEYTMRLAYEHDVVYAKRPMFEKNIADKITNFVTAGIVKSKHFVQSEVLYDVTDELLQGRPYGKKRFADFPATIEFGKSLITKKPQREQILTTDPSKSYVQPEIHTVLDTTKADTHNSRRPAQGYCIRTGEPIAFNPSRPFSYNAWKTWDQFRNPDYPENFCHLTGRPTNGRSSMRNPIFFED